MSFYVFTALLLKIQETLNRWTTIRATVVTSLPRLNTLQLRLRNTQICLLNSATICNQHVAIKELFTSFALISKIRRPRKNLNNHIFNA